jgi:hypothetical protein
VNWAIFGWHTRCIETEEEIPEISKWYLQQLNLFEESFTTLRNSFQCNEHKINYLNSQLLITPCTLSAIRQDLCLIVTGNGEQAKKIIPLVEIIEFIVGSSVDDEEISMIAITTQGHGVINFQLLDEAKRERWIEAWRIVLMFLQCRGGSFLSLPFFDVTNLP